MPLSYIPTDRLYKAAAIGGLALAVAMATLSYRSQVSLEERMSNATQEMVSLKAEFQLLQEDVDRALARKDTSAVNTLLERRKDIVRLNAIQKGKVGSLSRSVDSGKRDVIRFGVLGAIGLAIAIVGVVAWWRAERNAPVAP